MSDEEHYLEQVRKCVQSSSMYRQEAEDYAALITDPELKEEAEKLLDLQPSQFLYRGPLDTAPPL